MLRNCSNKYSLLSRLLLLAEPPETVRVASVLASLQDSNSFAAPQAAARAFVTSCDLSSNSDQSKWILAGTALGVATASLVYSQAETQLSTEEADNLPADTTSGWHLFSVETKQRLFYKYEKRIRELSTLEKIFDYFSTQEKDGVKHMAPADLLRSIVATFPAYGSTAVRGGHLSGEWVEPHSKHHVSKELCQLIDVDGDQLVSFHEYLFLLALLSIPLRDIETVFRVVDLDGNGRLDAQEFAAILHMLQAKAGLIGDKPRTGRTFNHKAVSLDKPAGLFAHFFGSELKGVVKVEQLVDFLRKLHEQLIVLEFLHYDEANTGTITCRDVAASLVASCTVQQADQLLDKMSNMPEKMIKQGVTLAEFKEVSKLYTHPYSDHLVAALEFYAMLGRPLCHDDVRKLLHNTLNIQLPDSVLDTLFYMFGTDEEHLDWKELMDVLKRRSHLPGQRGKAVQQTIKSPGASAQSYWRCVRSCAQADPQDAEQMP